MDEPQNLFEAKAESLSGTMNSHAGRVGFKIPEYQRTYDWKTENIKRLLENCLSGFDNCWRTQSPSYTFLGTIILVNEKQSKERVFDGTSLSVVDGQQRLTTLCLLCCALIEALIRHQHDIGSLNQANKNWLKEEIDFHMHTLFDCVIGRLPKRGHDFQFPRIVRGVDTRASNAKDAEYRSVVGTFLRDFGLFYAEQQREFEPKLGNGSEAQRLRANYDFIKEQIDLALDRVNDEDKDYTLDFERTGRTEFGQHCVRRLFEKLDFTNQKAANKAIDQISNTPAVSALVRLIAFSSYVTSSVVLTRVETEDDNYAFDIFDALNTTGEPLTAIETLRPRIIQFENRQKGFAGSDSEQHLFTLSKYLDQVYTDTEKRQKSTKELIVSFALYLEGSRLGQPLNAQRTYLRNGFDSFSNDLPGAEQRRQFVKSIADVAEFRYRYWYHGRPGTRASHSTHAPDELKLCIALINDMNTSLALPLLARYWVLGREGKIPESEFLDAAKALTAFLVLRRTVTGGTAAIDSEFRRLMGSQPATGGAPLCAGSKRPNVLLPTDTLKAELRKRYLNTPCDMSDKRTWVDRGRSVPLARSSRPLCRFLLLAGSHNARPDRKNPGLLTRDGVRRSEDLNYLSFAKWEDDLYATVEHVAPDSDPRGTWDPAIYEDNARHFLGNLILLPQKENAAIGNADWTKKKLYYRALTARTEPERDAALREAENSGLPFGKKTRDLLAANDRLGMLDSLNAVHTWNRSFIERRTKRLLSLAWDQIWRWLK